MEYDIEYTQSDSFDMLPQEKISQCYGVCFWENKIAIVLNGKHDTWGLVGGSVEEGETLEETLTRELHEEGNLKLIKAIPIGYQKVYNIQEGTEVYQLRYCCLVEKYGEFEKDPGGNITELKWIDPLQAKEYFDWGEIGERIIQRAQELVLEL
jgi:ADP-ribose pyrophosphatase YjhB (NUDIX family)